MPTSRRLIGWVVTAGAMAAVACGHAPPAAAQDSLCKHADKLATQDSAKARTAYADLLVTHPGLTCAREGLNAIIDPKLADAVEQAENLCDRGDVYANRGLDDDAKKAYDEA